MAALSPPRPASPREGGALKSDRIEAALAAALDGDSPNVFFDLVDRVSGMPGPRPHTDVLRAFGIRIASEGKTGAELRDAMLAQDKLSLIYVGTMALAAAAEKPNEKRCLKQLVDRADEVVKERRDAVIDGLVHVLAARGDEAALAIAPHADGYLHAFVALEALTTRKVLDRLSDAESLLGLLGDAFKLADEAPRAAGRSQGLRVLRAGLPAQIARASGRFRETMPWLEERLDMPRPETREVLATTVNLLRKHVGEAEADRLRARYDTGAKPPRDPTRKV
ncbi:MAG: hypothetical protein JNK04_23385, partial [Myxococcales bacterium]|nr:hypothetical protein [Myxococcales bacterium]